MDRSHVWDGSEPYITIGRLATIKEFRGRGYARIMVEKAVEYARTHQGDMVNSQGQGVGVWKGLVGAHAQLEVLRFYEGLGFEVDEGMGRWWEEGIEHVGIWKRVDVEGEGG